MEVMRKFKKSVETRATVFRETMEEYIRLRREMRRFMEKLERGETELREPMEETGPLEKETQVERGRNVLEEDPYDTKFLTHLRSTTGVGKCTFFRPMQQTDTHHSSDSIDVSVRYCGSRLVHFHAESSSIPAMEMKADGRRRFFPNETNEIHFCSRQDREPEPKLVSVRRERNGTEKDLDILFSNLHGPTPGESYLSYRGQTPDTDVLLNKPEETVRFDRSQKVDIHTDLHYTEPSSFFLNKPAETQRTECRWLPDIAMSPTMACTSPPIKPAETDRSDRGLPFVVDEQRHSLSSEHQETDKTETAQKHRSFFDEQRHSLSSEHQETDKTEKAQKHRSFFDELYYSLFSEHQDTGKTEKAQRQRSFLDELHINPSSFRLSLFGRHSGSGSTVALALSFLMFATMLCPAAGSLCVGEKEVVGMAVQKGQVVLKCPVAPGARQIKQSIIIVYVKSPTLHEEVLGCDWMARVQDFDCLESRFGAKLIDIKDDRVLVTLPEDKLHRNGPYKCKLAPAGIDEQFPDCDICAPAYPTTTTVRAVTMSTTGDLREPDDPQNRADAPSETKTREREDILWPMEASSKVMSDRQGSLRTSLSLSTPLVADLCSRVP